MINQEPKITSDEISIKDLIIRIKNAFLYIRSKWIVILMVSLLFGSLGFIYSLIKKPVYIGVCTFVVDDGGSKGGALAQYAGLASLAGISTGNAGGIFDGENILELYKSRSMIEKSLLTDVLINNKKQKLIDRYIDFSKLRDVWKKSNIQNISFEGDPKNFNRIQDSIITNFVDIFNKKLLNISKPDKKLGIIQVQVSTEDEVFSKEFTDALVQNVNDFYVFTKTKKSLQTVKLLQHQVDSVRGVLNSSINGVASAIDATPNANPSMLTLRVPSQRRQIDVQSNSTIYSEIVKNLEVAKLSLRQDTPLIQVIDNPVYPLEVNKLGKRKAVIIGMALGAILTVVVLIIKRVYKLILQ